MRLRSVNLYGFVENDPDGLEGVGIKPRVPGPQVPVVKFGEILLKGAEAYYKLHRIVALKNYNTYKEIGMHPCRGFEGVDWDKDGDNFNDAYSSYLKDLMTR